MSTYLRMLDKPVRLTVSPRGYVTVHYGSYLLAEGNLSDEQKTQFENDPPGWEVAMQELQTKVVKQARKSLKNLTFAERCGTSMGKRP